MKPEQKFWRNRVRPVMANIPGLKYERVELRTGKSGMPDVVYNMKRITTGWIELKWCELQNGFIDIHEWNVDQRRFARSFDTETSPVFLLVGWPAGAALIRSRYVLNMDLVGPANPGVLGLWNGPITIAGLSRLLSSDER